MDDEVMDDDLQAHLDGLPSEMSEGQRALEAVEFSVGNESSVPQWALEAIAEAYVHFKCGERGAGWVQKDAARLDPAPVSLGEAFGTKNHVGHYQRKHEVLERGAASAVAAAYTYFDEGVQKLRVRTKEEVVVYFKTAIESLKKADAGDRETAVGLAARTAQRARYEHFVKHIDALTPDEFKTADNGRIVHRLK